mgnify:CR=1 FL=1
MAIIYSYPTVVPKLIDKLIITQSFDSDDEAPVEGNPTRTALVSDVAALIQGVTGTVNRIPFFNTTSTLGDSIAYQYGGLVSYLHKITVDGSLELNTPAGGTGSNITLRNNNTSFTDGESIGKILFEQPNGELPTKGDLKASFGFKQSQTAYGFGPAFVVNLPRDGNTNREVFRVDVGGFVALGQFDNSFTPAANIHIQDYQAELRLEYPSGAPGFARVFTGTNDTLKLGAGDTGATMVEVAGNERNISFFGDIVIDNGESGSINPFNRIYKIAPRYRGISNTDLDFSKDVIGGGAGQSLTYMRIGGVFNQIPNIEFFGEIRPYAGAFFSDNVKANFGSSDDLKIYHDGSHNIITGTPNLYVQTAGLFNVETTSEVDMIKATAGDTVDLYYAGQKKFSTALGGIDIFDSRPTGFDSRPNATIQNQLTGDRSDGTPLGGFDCESRSFSGGRVTGAGVFFVESLPDPAGIVGVATTINVTQGTGSGAQEAVRVNAGGKVGFGNPAPESIIDALDTNAKITLRHKLSSGLSAGKAAMFTGLNNALKFSAGSGDGVTLMELAGNERDISLFGRLTIDNSDGNVLNTAAVLYTIEPSARNTTNPQLHFTRKNGTATPITYMKVVPSGTTGDPQIDLQADLHLSGGLTSDPSIKSIAKDIEITGSDYGLIIQSPDGTKYRISVANGGALSASAV